jgi:hypothetical protein
MKGGFSAALFAQALGVFQAQFGRRTGFLIGRNDAIPGRQFKLIVGGARQALEFVQVKAFNLLARPISFFRNLTLDSMLGFLLKQLIFK